MSRKKKKVYPGGLKAARDRGDVGRRADQPAHWMHIREQKGFCYRERGTNIWRWCPRRWFR